jgi:Zn-finger nucleic acid-binding protein
MLDSFDPTAPRVTATEFLLQRGERHCPVCGQAMHVRPEQGALADVCPEHGVWFDQEQWEQFAASRRAPERRANHIVATTRPEVRRYRALPPEEDDLYEGLFELGGGD